MVDERGHLAQVDRYVAEAKEHIRRQQRLIERLTGGPLEEAVEQFDLDHEQRSRLLIRGRVEIANYASRALASAK